MAPVNRGMMVRRPSGFQPQNQAINQAVLSQFRQPLYDRVNLSTTLTGEYRFFTNPIGASQTLIRYETAAAVGKTKRDTNLTSQGQDSSRAYSVQGIGMALIPAARTVLATAVTRGIRRDKDNIKEGGYLTFKIVDNLITDLPLLLIPEVNSETGVSTTGNDATAWAGPGFSSSMYNFEVPVDIPKGTNFSFTVTWDGSITLAQTFDMYIFLFSKMRRPS